jgi:peptide/nickel transport system substrate-binding protein
MFKWVRLASTRYVLALCAVFVLAVLACGDDATPAPTAVPAAKATATPTAVPTAAATPVPTPTKKGGTLIHVPASDISQLDPAPSGILPDFYHGMLAYDHLFGMDADGVPQPQMVDEWSVSSNGLDWTFTLRDNLSFHDGSPVTTDEVICSLERNINGRSVLGKLLKVDLGSFEKVDANTFSIHLTDTFGLVLDTLAENAVGSAIIYNMTDCKVDPLEAADVKIGNGPMRFSYWNPGTDAMYVRNEQYVPRTEPVSDYAGGKIINIDELKYVVIPDRNTRAMALETGLVNMIDFPLEDDYARLEAADGVTVRFDRLMGFDFVTMNQLAPPFDNLNARKALITGIPQADLLAAAYPPGFGDECASSFGCGGRWEAPGVGPQSMYIDGDIAKAKELWAQSGYDGRPIKIRTFADRPNMYNFGLVVQQFLEDELGAKTELLVGDISATFKLVNGKAEAEEGNWNISMIWSTAGGLDPVRNSTMRGPWNGWGDRPNVTAWKSDFARAVTGAEKDAIVAQIQEEYLTDAAVFVAGQHKTYRAWSSNVKDVISPGTRTYPIFWGLYLEQ